MAARITPHMVTLVESEAARCRALSIYVEAIYPAGAANVFVKEWIEVADALEAAVEIMREKMVDQHACG